ncbi:hypothetical protein EC973_008612 [Apophysomyces ossiformis]|uniref:Uncharacterized protein n=1 Tax=Apophysomyces ossiformis TaxID=679940 RepID=A0A8H7BNA0_9FUNG|nr:hypothetical protein EC973_008612 [Apophysomyces ossiformis]
MEHCRSLLECSKKQKVASHSVAGLRLTQGMDIAEDTFLPTRRDQLKAEINSLRQRLSRTRDERQKLKRELVEEKIGHIISAKFSEEIKDPSRQKAVDLREVQQKIFQQMIAATEARCVKEMKPFIDASSYRETYYLLFLRDLTRKVSIQRHTIPHFIPIESLERQFLQDDQETFLRILHDLLQAYVSRREQVEELKQLAEQKASIMSVNARTVEKNNVTIVHNSELHIELYYDVLAADYPTRVKITPLTSDVSPESYTHLERIFYLHKLAEAYVIAFG